MGFLDTHPPLQVTPSDSDRNAFMDTLRRTEEVIRSRRAYEQRQRQPDQDWISHLPEYKLESVQVIRERGGDPEE
jgi:hypothetical protein